MESSRTDGPSGGVEWPHTFDLTFCGLRWLDGFPETFPIPCASSHGKCHLQPQKQRGLLGTKGIKVLQCWHSPDRASERLCKALHMPGFAGDDGQLGYQ